MLELKNVTYVVNDARQIILLASIFGCGNGTDYVCCGKASLVAGDPVMQTIAEHDADGTLDDYVDRVLPHAADAIRRLKPLMLYGYQVPEYAVYYEEFTANPVFSTARDRQFVLVCTHRSDMLAYAKFIEQNGIAPKQCYVSFIEVFSKDGIEDADSLMPFAEAMDEYVDTLDDKGWTDEPHNRRFKDIVWLQERLGMTNTQMAMYFGIKLRTIENWRAKPDSMPDYAWQYFVQSCFMAKPYLEHRYGSDVDGVLAGCQ